MRIYCATTNPGKLREFRLAAHGVEILPLPDLDKTPECPETGDTFEANAIQKALYHSARVPDLLFAEDSGLEVRSLGGAPGIYSARFAGAAASDEDNNRLLLERLDGVSDRSARYVAVVALASGGSLVRTFRGEVAGEILDAPRGRGGFGYDPLFYYPPYGRTFAETSADEKLAVSHRGAALAALFRWLAETSSK